MSSDISKMLLRKSSENEEVGCEELRKEECCIVCDEVDCIIITGMYIP